MRNLPIMAEKIDFLSTPPNLQFDETPKREDGEGDSATKEPSRSPSRSPEPQCSICLGRLKNKSFTDSCFHQFCFDCLQKWSKVRAVCPLCKHQFKSIIHNVRSDQDFDQYDIPPPEPDPWPDLQQLGHRFSYRTTFTPDRMRALAIQRILLQSRLDGIFPRPFLAQSEASLSQRPRRRNPIAGTSEFRRRVYDEDLWVDTSPDITGRYRESSPEFYRDNPATMHRLGPWLTRELNVLLDNRPATQPYVTDMIMELITRYRIESPEMEDALNPHMASNTTHFLHEFYNFARSPYDIPGYDLHATYNAGPRNTQYVETAEILSSSDDSDVILIESSPELSRLENSSPVPGPSRQYTSPPLAIAGTSSETVKREDSDSDLCEIVDVLKPKHERTPVVVTLSDDSAVEECMSDVWSDKGWSTPDSDASASKRKRKNSDSDWAQPEPVKKKKKKSKKSSCSSSCRKSSSKRKKKSKHRHWKKSMRKSFTETVDPSENGMESPQPSTSRGQKSKYKPKIDRSKFRKSTDSRKDSPSPPMVTRVSTRNSHAESTSSYACRERVRLDRRCKTYASAALEHSPVLDLFLSDDQDSSSSSDSRGWKTHCVRNNGLKLKFTMKGRSRRVKDTDDSSDSDEDTVRRRRRCKKVNRGYGNVFTGTVLTSDSEED